MTHDRDRCLYCKRDNEPEDPRIADVEYPDPDPDLADRAAATEENRREPA